MIRIPAATVFLAGLTLAGAAAERTTPANAPSDTLLQHHLWSQKFDTALDPETTGSVNPQPVSGAVPRRAECVPAGLQFSDPPLPNWRIGSCS
jgi:hypothetical protein